MEKRQRHQDIEDPVHSSWTGVASTARPKWVDLRVHCPRHGAHTCNVYCMHYFITLDMCQRHISCWLAFTIRITLITFKEVEYEEAFSYILKICSISIARFLVSHYNALKSDDFVFEFANVWIDMIWYKRWTQTVWKVMLRWKRLL